MTELLAGWSKRDITPPPNFPLAGYIARKDVASGVLGPILVRALVLRQGQRSVAIVLAELLLVSNRWAKRLRLGLARCLHNERKHVIVAATHTHSGPLVDTSPFQFFTRRREPRLRAYLRSVEAHMAQAVRSAEASLRPVEVALARVRVRGVASDRNHPAQGREQPFFLMRFKTADGSALLGAYGCHPTVLGHHNTLVSGDLHGEVARRLETRCDCALIANSAAGNVSTRFTRRRQSPAELARLATLVAHATAAPRWHRLLAPQLRVVECRLRFPVRDLEQVRTRQPAKGGRLAVVAKEARQNLARLRRSPAFARKSVRAGVNVLRLGEVGLAALPFETYSDTGEFLWGQAKTAALCYANGYWGYVPSPAAAEDDYEAISSPFDRRADRLLRENVIRMALSLRRPAGRA